MLAAIAAGLGPATPALASKSAIAAQNRQLAPLQVTVYAAAPHFQHRQHHQNCRRSLLCWHARPPACSSNPHSPPIGCGTRVPCTPRFRALALFGRLPSVCADGSVMQASENLHTAHKRKSRVRYGGTEGGLRLSIAGGYKRPLQARMSAIAAVGEAALPGTTLAAVTFSSEYWSRCERYNHEIMKYDLLIDSFMSNKFTNDACFLSPSS